MKLLLIVVMLLSAISAPSIGDGWCGSDEWCGIVWGEEGE